MRFINFHLFLFCTANQYLDLGVSLHQIDNAHDGINCFPAASDPYVNSCSIHRRRISQVPVVNPIYETWKPGMGRALWSVDYDFGSIHQRVQCIPKILNISIHLFPSFKRRLIELIILYAAGENKKPLSIAAEISKNRRKARQRGFTAEKEEQRFRSIRRRLWRLMTLGVVLPCRKGLAAFLPAAEM